MARKKFSLTCLRRPNTYSEINSLGSGDKYGLGPAIVRAKIKSSTLFILISKWKGGWNRESDRRSQILLVSHQPMVKRNPIKYILRKVFSAEEKKKVGEFHLISRKLRFGRDRGCNFPYFSLNVDWGVKGKIFDTESIKNTPKKSLLNGGIFMFLMKNFIVG